MSKIYQLKIALQHIKPQIWRQILISDKSSLNDLHYVIQDAFNWENSHIHQFIDSEGTYYTDPMFEPEDEENEYDFALSDVLKNPKGKLSYVYDMGDNWELDIILEKIMEPDSNLKYPCCMAGKRCTPPEDSGGPWGYEEFCEIISDPEHEEHQSMMEWLGGEFDPEFFDIDETNEAIAEENCKSITQEMMGQFE